MRKKRNLGFFGGRRLDGFEGKGENGERKEEYRVGAIMKGIS